MPNITYVHTAQRETISIHEALEKAVMPDKMKLILKIRTQMVESIIGAKLYICTLLDPRLKKFCQVQTLRIHSCAQSVYSCVKLYDIKTDMLSVV